MVVFSGWRKSEKNKVRDRLLLDAIVSFVRRGDTGLKFWGQWHDWVTVLQGIIWLWILEHLFIERTILKKKWIQIKEELISWGFYSEHFLVVLRCFPNIWESYMVADVWRFVADKIGTLRIRRLVKMCFYVSLKFQITDIYPVCLSVLKHASAKYATNAFSSKKN